MAKPPMHNLSNDYKSKSELKSCLTFKTEDKSNTEETTNSGTAEHRKRVIFKHVAQRQYDKIALGDNPSVTKGAAITLGGTFSESTKISVDEYELNRGRRRNDQELILSEEERKESLLTSGYSIQQIEKAMADLKKSKAQRAITKRDLYKSEQEEAMEVLISWAKRFTKFRKRDEYEIQLKTYIKAAKTA